jgi:antitoxin (DNA-binding transcriptional repressor) of toxin-antitoxin stability system
LSALVEEAAAGHEIVIAKAGVPRARLVPMRRVARRRPGGSTGRIRIAANFDAPMPREVLAAFGGKKR